MSGQTTNTADQRRSVSPEVHKAHIEALREATRRRVAVARRALVGADVLAAALSPLIAATAAHNTARPTTLFLIVMVVLAAKLAGLYDRDEVRLRKSTLEEVPALFQLSGLCALTLWLADGTVFRHELARIDVVGVWLTLLTLLSLARVVARFLADRLVSPERCLVIGDPGATGDIAETLNGRRAEIVGRIPLVDRRNADDAAVGELCADLEWVACDTQAHRIIIVPGVHGDGEAALAAVSRAQQMGIGVSLLPRIGEVVGSSIELDHVDGVTLLGIHSFGLSRSSLVLKRAIDVLGSGLGLLLLSPLIALTAIVIRLESRGPVFFRQPRVGRRGDPFEMVKFRTMYDGADRARAELYALSHAGEGMFKLLDDPRVTRVGRVLRRHSLDEFPQLINVFRGEMSLVGPRPLILEEDALIQGRHRRRLDLKPGMTGPWQVVGSASRRVPMRDMVTLDYLYAGNWSLWTDVKILLRTVVHVARGQGL